MLWCSWMEWSCVMCYDEYMTMRYDEYMTMLIQWWYDGVADFNCRVMMWCSCIHGQSYLTMSGLIGNILQVIQIFDDEGSLRNIPLISKNCTTCI